MAGLVRLETAGMNVFVNGESRQFEKTISVAELLLALELTGKRIAVELNGEIAPRSLHAATLLKEGDRLEVVHAIGGG
jgi:sulfur carrier protein